MEGSGNDQPETSFMWQTLSFSFPTHPPGGEPVRGSGPTQPEPNDSSHEDLGLKSARGNGELPHGAPRLSLCNTNPRPWQNHGQKELTTYPLIDL